MTSTHVVCGDHTIAFLETSKKWAVFSKGDQPPDYRTPDILAAAHDFSGRTSLAVPLVMQSLGFREDGTDPHAMPTPAPSTSPEFLQIGDHFLRKSAIVAVFPKIGGQAAEILLVNGDTLEISEIVAAPIRNPALKNLMEILDPALQIA